MDEMRIKSRLMASILTKLLRRYFLRKFGAEDISIIVQDFNISMEGEKGEFSVIAHGSFSRDDVAKLAKELLSE